MPEAGSLTVEADVADQDSFFRWRGYRWASADDGKRREEAAAALAGLVVTKGAVVGHGSPFSVVILKTEPASDGFLEVTPNTRIRLGAPEPRDPMPMNSEDNSTVAGSGPPGGLKEPYERLLEVVRYPILYADQLKTLGVDVPRGVLLYGPPGVGKTLLVRTVARDCGARLVVINGAEVASPFAGEGEAALERRFAEAASGDGRPSILFIDEIDALAPPREQSSPSTLRLLAHLAHLLDRLPSLAPRAVVVAATNRPGGVDASLRRGGRLDREIGVDPPGAAQRAEILRALVRGVGLAPGTEMDEVVGSTPGFVGADLENLVREACAEAARRGGGEGVSTADFAGALRRIGPSSAARGWTLDVGARRGWESVGGLEGVKRKLRQAVEWPVLHAGTFARLGLRPPRGVLLYGPPGCSKTTLARVVAGTAGLNFASLDVAGLYSSYVGDSERLVRQAFTKARAAVPCVLFLDELDAMAGDRGHGSSGSSDAVQGKILSALLNEMDGIESADGVLVVAATNRPWAIDAALLRPGRFDRLVYVPPPDRAARERILEIYAGDMPRAAGVDFARIAGELATDLFSGADVENLCREAALGALRRGLGGGGGELEVTMADFEAAAALVKPSLSREQLDRYERFEAR
ncbi:P-loop containing nucleoside triphosphate hydrolase protein [Hyaloraphidium curvatum]|nr:P-loop containing nucleoside triphosphate hydrolase protein [Hyaloraphidium curvatum]